MEANLLKDRRYQDSNYSGFWPVWDVIFRSFNHPDRCPLGALGIEQSPVPQGFVDQLLFPFRAQVRPPRQPGCDAPGTAADRVSAGFPDSLRRR